ncbi:MAG: type II secretion system F family protein [Nanoarchaeota archaeon]
MIPEIIKNLEFEMKILREISLYNSKLNSLNPKEKDMMNKTLDSLRESMKLVNSSVKNMIKEISLASPLRQDIIKKEKFEEVSMNLEGTRVNLTLEKGNKNKFLNELRISQEVMHGIRKEDLMDTPSQDFRAARSYLKLANGLFLPTAKKFSKKESFQKLSTNLKKANMNFLLEGYISLMFLVASGVLFLSLCLFVSLMFLDFNISAPYISTFEGNVFSRALQTFWIVLVFPVLAFFIMYWYPSSEKDSLQSKIDQELPFAVVNMSAISGSGVEPTVIFKIIAMGNEYPALRKEFIKLMNQINLQGYDLVTALNNSAKNSPSKKLAELFSGIAVTIGTGGELGNFFEKRAQSLVTEYRLSREKFTKLAETSMDLYITIVIAAPMILLLIFVLLGITDFGPSLSPQLMTFILILVIAVMNVIFLAVMRLKQPTY